MTPAHRSPDEAVGSDGLADLLIHSDKSCLAFNKPSGLAVQGGSGVDDCLEHRVARAFGRPGKTPPRLVHRLDRETSGVIVLARTKPAAAFFSAAFAERRAEKTYLAVVCGGPPAPQAGEIDLPMVKGTRRGVDLAEPARPGQAGAKAALTRYATLAATPQAALLQLTPLTGRMHQLRLHLASLGRPIAGDGKYGGLFTLAGQPVPRLMLHAQRLVLDHPDGGVLDLTAPPPGEFADYARRLGLDHAALLA
jgi:tRNA pseudouridine32 synthase/23S rRNA pseudouridine746 synthase